MTNPNWTPKQRALNDLAEKLQIIDATLSVAASKGFLDDAREKELALLAWETRQWARALQRIATEHQ